MAKFDFRNSEVAYKVLRRIRLEDGSYLTEIKEEENLSQGQVSDALSVLKDNNLIKKGERSKVQLYNINYDGFSDLLIDLFAERVDKEDDFESFEELFDEFRYEKTNPDENEIRLLIKHYVKNYLSLNKKSTVEKMLTDDFSKSIQNTQYLDIISPEAVTDLKKHLPKVGGDAYSIPVMLRSVVDILSSQVEYEDVSVELNREIFPKSLPHRIDRFLSHLYSKEGELDLETNIIYRCKRCGQKILVEKEEGEKVPKCACREYKMEKLYNSKYH